jgi:hypothetical protein
MFNAPSAIVTATLVTGRPRPPTVLDDPWLDPLPRRDGALQSIARPRRSRAAPSP